MSREEELENAMRGLSVPDAGGRIRQNLDVEIPAGGTSLHGDLHMPDAVRGVVLFAHGSGSSRKSPRNQFVARVLHQARFATLLFDLLTEAEEREDDITAQLRFNIDLLAGRLEEATRWLRGQKGFERLAFGYFGASTGAAAALKAAARIEGIEAVVSRGGRPDLAATALPNVRAAVLLIVGEKDYQVIELNQEAEAQLPADKKLEIVPGATHLFEEPGALEQVAEIARNWFERYLGRSNRGAQAA